MSGPPWGVVPGGFNRKPLSAIVADMQAQMVAAFPGFDLSPTGQSDLTVNANQIATLAAANVVVT